LRPAQGFADFFLICSGQNIRQIKAIADAIQAAIDARPAHVEGYDGGGWILLDYFDFIVHIFSPETRAFYDLERLWGSAERIDIPEPEPLAT
jgi:ribosome-associated protein